MNLKSMLPKLGIAKRLSGKHDPFNLFKREINGLIDRALTGYSLHEIGHGDLNLDICDKGKELELKIEVPGVLEEDIQVSVKENNLIISGEKKAERTQDRNNYYYMSERVYGSFMRSVPLPFKVNTDKVEAELEQGVLTIRVPKPKEISSNAHTIKIKKTK